LAGTCELKGYKREPEWSRKNWMDIILRDLKYTDTSW